VGQRFQENLLVVPTSRNAKRPCHWFISARKGRKNREKEGKKNEWEGRVKRNMEG
jgi:hypothetical protein